jgi:glycosyltransferase involved in cell wall biosynthesis
MYSRSKLTVCPQKWEQFGLVPVESMACGTPVLAFNCMGFQETIGETGGWLVGNEKDFLRILQIAIEKEPELSIDLRRSIIGKYSTNASVKALENILKTRLT